MNKKRIILLRVLFFLGIQFLQAQEETTYFEVDYGYGSILKHKAVMGHLVRAHPELYSVSWFKTASTTSWKEEYNYPDWGFTLIHQRFNNPVLGNVTAINYANNFYLLKRNNKNQLSLGMGAGLGYSTNPLDFEDNNQNVSIASAIPFSVHFKLNYAYTRIYNNIGFHAGLLFTHYSNSSVKMPNFGVNSVFLNTGLSYISEQNERRPYPEKVTNLSHTNESIHFNIGTEFSMHEIQAPLGAKPVIMISTYANKQISRKSGLRTGFDFSASQAFKDYAEFSYHVHTEDADRTLKDHRQIGFFVGHELYFNKWLFESNVGYYLYNPLKKTPMLYQRLGFKYRIKESTFSIGFSLKVHKFRADNMSFGLHYQFY